MRYFRLAVFSIAALALVPTLGSQTKAAKKLTKTVTFDTPACPIKAFTAPLKTTEYRFPNKNHLGDASVSGTVQIADQTGGVIFKLSLAATVNDTGVTFSRTVNTIQHLAGLVNFDHGCTASDPFGSNHCTWTWGDSISTSYLGALLEDVTSGKLVVDLLVDNTTPVSFSCAVCGGTCTITVPEKEDGGWTLISDGLNWLLNNSLLDPSSHGAGNIH